MNNRNLHIITGASRGLGASLARQLAERGDQVVSLSSSRQVDHAHPLIRSILLDLSGDFSATVVVGQIFDEFPPNRFERLTLTNNAALIDPISPGIRLQEAEVRRNLAVNLIAPMLLSAEFLKRTADHSSPRIVLNVSSGVARRPKACWSAYSAAKAGLEAFSVALAKELESDPRVRVLTLDPGIMDTGMQERIRRTDQSDFPEVGRFIGFKDQGLLLSPEVVAKAASRLLLGDFEGNQTHFSIAEF